MEGTKIYDESNQELANIIKTLGTDKTEINWNKLDERTKGALNTAISEVTHRRQREIQSIILGVQK